MTAKEKESGLSDMGFPKNPIVLNMRGEKLEGLGKCVGVNKLHRFRALPLISKHQRRGDGKDDIVVFSVFACSYCLTHVYLEVQRVLAEDMIGKGEDVAETQFSVK